MEFEGYIKLTNDELDLLTNNQRKAYHRKTANVLQIINWIKEAKESVKLMWPILSDVSDDIDFIPGKRLITGISGEAVCQTLLEEDDFCNEFIFEEDEFVKYAKKNNILCLIIRQFLEETIDIINDKGEHVNVPKKNLYACIIAAKEYMWLSEEEVFEIYGQDNETKEILPIDNDINYCGYYFRKDE